MTVSLINWQSHILDCFKTGTPPYWPLAVYIQNNGKPEYEHSNMLPSFLLRASTNTTI